MAGVSGRPAKAQGTAPDESQKYGWVSGGVGLGRLGLAGSVAGGAPIGYGVFVGGRCTRTEELDILGTSPVGTFWEAGPLVGLVEQGRWGQVSLATGVAVVGGSNPDEAGTRPSTLGLPLDVQIFFAPIRHLGIGVHGYTNVNTGDNMPGWSVQLQIRLPQ